MKEHFTYRDDEIKHTRIEQGFIDEEMYRSILENVPIVCVDVALVQENRIWLIKRNHEPNKNVYWIQGGRLNKNESARDCAIRKVAEELNIAKEDIEITGFLGTYSSEFHNSEQGPPSHTVNLTFTARLRNSIDPGFDGDHSHGCWFYLNGQIPRDLEGYQHHPYIQAILARIKPVTALVCGVSGFIGSHLGRRLKNEGFHVIGADWRDSEFLPTEQICHEFKKVDFRNMQNCLDCTLNVDWVFNLAADMGGMGFIQSNHSRIGYNNTLVSLNLLEASRSRGVQRYFYSSSACVYPTDLQADNSNVVQLKEELAWPANPQDIYGLEKLYAEEIAMQYSNEFPDLVVRLARFHGIYGEFGTWRGGREKVVAAFCRKAATSTKSFEIWGDGKQMRSFCYIDDCIEAIIRIMRSDYNKPLNIGSDEAISMNDFARLVMNLAGKDLPIVHTPGPEGVRSRNSDNTLIKEVLGWAPNIPLQTGLKKTYEWIAQEVEKMRSGGDDLNSMAKSQVVQTRAPSLDFVS